MKTNFDKKSPKRLLGYLMASALVFFTGSVIAQTNHDVLIDSPTNTFAPTALTIDVGDTVTFTNDGGFHNVNGDLSTYPNNADGSLYSGAASSSWVTYVWVCNTAGNYDYQCDPHLGLGMVGSITANGPPPVLGCTDANATNYDPAADTDDGSCVYPCLDNAIVYTPGSYPSENSWTITDCDGTVLFSGDGATGYDGCDVLPAIYTLNLVDSYGDGWNGGELSIDGVVYTQDDANYSWPYTSDATESYQVGVCPVYGCTDTTAANFDAAADTDDGSCTYGVAGCIDMNACNYDAAATADDGSCTYAVAGYDCTGACLSGEEVTLTLTDSYGDTWNGGTLTVNGVVYDQPTTAPFGTGGGSDSYTFCMDLSVCTDIIYTAGSYSSENSWSLSDASGAVIASGGDASGIVGNTPGFDCAGACLTGDLVTITLYDSYGDTWNGGTLTVNGVVYDQPTTAPFGTGGGADSYTTCVDLTACTDIIYTAGSYSTENSWDVVDATGTVIASGGNASGNVGACAVYGCTDPAAANYDPAANTDDGSCIVCNDNWVTISCGGGSFQSEVSWTLLNSAGTPVLTGGAGVFGAPFTMDMCLPSDCYTVDMVDSYGDGWNGNIFEISMMGVSVGSATISSGSAGTADISVGAICYVYGCTDTAAVNYDAFATADDGSCVYTCTAAPYCENFDLGVGTWTNNGWVNDGGGTTSGSTGPTDDITGGAFYMYYETSTGYAPTIDITSECLDISSLANPTLSFYNHMYGATVGDLNVYVNGNLEWTMSGDQGNQWNWVQVDLSAYAAVDVTIMIEAVYGGSFTGDIAIDNVCVDEFLVVSGCTDPIALNYDPTANTDDGSCTYCPGTMMTLNMYDSFGDGWNGGTFTATGNSTGLVYGPYTIASGAAATEMICMDDDCYTIQVGGGTWDSEITWEVIDPSGAIVASGAAPYLNQGGLSVGVICPVYGCTDVTALNYDSLATADDGSCAYLCDVYVASASVDAPPSCNGAFDASATCYIDGSFGGDFYLWNDPNGQTGSTATGLAAGTYTCTVTDSVNGCVSVATVVIDPTPVISIAAFVADATPNNTNGSVDLTVSGGTPCYNGSAMSLAGASSTSTQWASNAFDVVATSDLQITSIDQPFMSGMGTADVYYRLGSGSGFEADPNGWMLAGSASIMTNFIGDVNNIPVSINVGAGETVCIYVHGVGVNTTFGAGVDSTYNSVVSSDANLSIIGGFATGGAPGSGTTYPSAGSYDFGGNVNYSLSNYTYAWSNGATSEDANGLGLGPISVTVTDCNGCTASWTGFVLTNYAYGCMDTLAFNYDPAANTSWDQDTTGATPACIYLGCIDALANNYDATANQDDGSCTYSCAYYGWDAELTVTFAPDWYSDENSWYIINALTGDTALASQPYASGGAVDVQTLCAMNGCYYVDGYDSFGDGWGNGSGTLDIVDAAGNSVLSAFTLGASTTFNTSSVFSVGGTNCTAGCMDSTYTNFDVNAVLDDGSCSDSIVGCTDPAAVNYTQFSNYDDGSCCYDNWVSVSVGGGSWQGEVGWTLSLDSTIFATGGAPYASDLCLPDGCYTVDMTDSYGDGWNGNVFEANSGGAVIGSGGLTSGSAGSFTFAVGTGDCAVFGCIDPTASNYDASATDDDGSCCFDNFTSITTGMDYVGTAYDWEFNGLSWALTLLGDTVPSGVGSQDLGGAWAGGPADLCLPDGCYEFAGADVNGFGVYAWFNINGTQYEGPANGGTYGLPISLWIEVGAATCPIMGCTDPNSSDYDSTATYDDGSCTYPCLLDEVTLNMYDSYGDGWNGGFLTVDGVDYTITTGAFGSSDLCLDLSGCIDFTWTAGAWDAEVSWDVTDASGAVIASGVAASTTLGNGCTYLGCTDSTAINYDANANTDDGSCTYTCTAAPYCENFDAGVSADWSNNGWTLDALGTTSSSTGPSDDYTGGGNYMYFETSSPVAAGDQVSLTTLCLDISMLATPTLSFYNHMYGASMGTLDVLVNGTNVWSMSGDQGNQWNWAQVDLSAYAGNTNISIEFVGTAAANATGTVFWGDMAIDEVCVDEYLVVDGCTDPTALNYDPLANNDDGSCTYCTYTNYDVVVGGGSFQGEVSWTILASDGTVMLSGGAPFAGTACLPDDCYTVDMVDSYGDGWNGNTIDISTGGASVGSGGLLAGSAGSFDFSLGGVACPVYGCTDSTAANYDAAANADDGSCDYLGCTNPTATNYDATATIDDGSCTFGCADNTVNVTAGGGTYDSEISWDIVDGSGTVVASGFAGATTTYCLPDDCYTVNMYDSYGDGWNGGIITLDDGAGNVLATDGLVGFGVSTGSFTIALGSASCPVYGCTDPAANNYDASADTDDGSCTYCTDNVVLYTAGSWSAENDFTITDCAGNVIASMTAGAGFDQCIDLGTDYSVNLVDTYGDGWNGGSLSIDGVTYTLDEINDDGASASFQVGFCAAYGCTDPAALNYDATANTDDGSCTYCVDGCTDATQFNYDPNATCDDGSCQPFTYGCTDATASNYNSTVNTDDGSCVYLGCTDATADNYDATATVDDGSCTYNVVDGCTDPTATNYDASATNDDGSCTYSSVCTEDAPTGLFVDGIIHSRAVINWDNMNSSTCTVDQYRIRYREVGTSSWTQKTMGGPIGSCTWGNQRIDKLLLNLTGNTTYEYEMKAWYCGGGASSWTGLSTFTTADNCPNVGNLTAVGANPTKATFTWDASNGSYEFVRLKARVDSISNPTGSDWFQIGGAGVAYGTYTKDKNGLTAGETYRGQARAFCDPNGGAYFSLSWTPLVYWTQPTSRIEGGTAIANLDVYPNPSRDLFNVTFTSEDVQDLEVRVINVVGEVVYTENLQQFVGEYTKSIDLESYTKGVYFLEITTNNGVVNKKLILQ